MKIDANTYRDLYSNVVFCWHRTPVLHEEQRDIRKVTPTVFSGGTASSPSWRATAISARSYSIVTFWWHALQSSMKSDVDIRKVLYPTPFTGGNAFQSFLILSAAHRWS